jgi:hypothetical protein
MAGHFEVRMSYGAGRIDRCAIFWNESDFYSG